MSDVAKTVSAYCLGDRVKTRILGVDVETTVLDVRYRGNRTLEVWIKVPQDIEKRAKLTNPLELRFAERLKREGMWCFATGVTKI